MSITNILIVPVVCRRSKFFSKLSGAIYIAQVIMMFTY